ncbi:MAG: M81 family metallopeptidase [Anaerolineae bacterium]|nr:M81 family metallopeptidase [Anaerolineae bacterium]
MRVLGACVAHETNTFSAVPTTLEDFRRASPGPDPGDGSGFGSGQAIVGEFEGTRSMAGGFLDGAREHGLDLELLMWTFATPGGTVRQDAYEFMRDLLLRRMREAGACDGVLLHLHGAMVSEDIEDVEGDLLTAVRGVVGPDVPIVVTLDLHANVTAEMARQADVLVGYDEYPHSDIYERGVEAAGLLAAILEGRLKPTMAYRQLPLVTMPPKQCTLRQPMLSLLSLAREIEARPGIANVTLALGFPFADVRDVGVSVLVTADGDRTLAEATAVEMAQAVWDRRDEFQVELTPVAEAIEYAQTRARGLVVLADGSDNPGGGGPCDGTVILRELIEREAQDAVVAIIADPEAVAMAVEAGVGNSVTLDLGGKTDDRHGPPVHLTGYVRLISDGSFVGQGPMSRGVRAHMGRTVVLVVGGVEVVVTERRLQPLDAELLRSVGIEPTRRRIVALKSAVHFRSTYQDLAERIFDMDTPGVHRPDFSAYEYRRLRRPVYPLDQVSWPERR